MPKQENNEKSIWGSEATQYFYALTPEKVLDHVEAALEVRATGRIFALNSMENRVYDIELDDPYNGSSNHVIAKFYRPGRWSKDQINEEHRYIEDLVAHEIPAIAPLELKNGSTLGNLPEESIFFAVFPKIGGRSPALADLKPLDYSRLGQLLGRMHNIGSAKNAKNRLILSEITFGREPLDYLLQHNLIPDDYKLKFETVCKEIFKSAEHKLKLAKNIRLHGDCHVGNVLMRDDKYSFIDFDDMVNGPAIQDFWLLLPGRAKDCPEELESLLRGYEVMRSFSNSEIDLIEILRSLRMIHFSGWIGRRYEDPAFKKQFPEFGSTKYWGEQIQDLYQQLEYLSN